MPPQSFRGFFTRKFDALRELAAEADRQGGSGTTAATAANALLGVLAQVDGQLSVEPVATVPQGGAIEQFRIALGPTSDLHWRNASIRVRSVSDALTRLDWLLRALASDRVCRRFYFRGQEDLTYELRPSAWRMLDGRGIAIPTPGVLHGEEVRALEEFQTRFLSGGTWAHPDDLRRFSLIPRESSAWWSLKQHYDGGTRLLDVSCSALEGLYFACVAWNGSIDESRDGVLHVFPESTIRVMHDHGPVSDVQDRTAALWRDMFQLSHPGTPRVYFPSRLIRNERLRVQRGAFLLWPDLGAPYPNQSYYLVVAKEHKRDIARELFQFGVNPRQIVDGPQGETAYQTVCGALGVSPEPFD